MAGSRTLKLSILADIDNLQKNLKAGENDVEGFGGKLDGFAKKAGVAFAAAGAAALAYAGKLAVEGVKAAIEDEAAQQRLETALKAVTGATEDQIIAIEDQILKTSLATGVADDKLRPALGRLATATGDVEESQKLLNLALDISAATGKDVETVSGALAKAYEGNTRSLETLGIGLEKGEVKTTGLRDSVQKLTDLYGGAAATQAETFEGKIARVGVAFDEAKETLGAALLPLIEKFILFITDTAIPKLQEFKRAAIDPVIKAFKDNEEALRDTYNFLKDIMVPFLSFTLFNNLKGLSTVASIIVNAVSAAIRALEPIINAAIIGINAIISLKNALTGGSNTALIPKVNFSSGGTGGNTVAPGGLPFGGSAGTGGAGGLGATGTGTGASSGNTGTLTVPNVTPILIPTGTAIPSSFNPAAVRAGEERSNVTINVNGAIDPASTARQIAEILNNEAAISGTFTNLGVSRFAIRAE